MIPEYLLHKVTPFNPELAAAVMESIRRVGLIPRLPTEYRRSLPMRLQRRPLVWLAGRMDNPAGMIVQVRTALLDAARLVKLDWADVDWWVYQGIIKPEAIMNMIEEEKPDD